ncbi:MAG TPA: hypothetical protein VIC82_03570 [Candidatus Nanopelagicales bacterium]|jgi:hypothetical protein
MLHEVAQAHEDDPEVDLSVPVTDMLTARHLLIELARNSAKQSQYKATLAAIHGEYAGRIAALADREQLVRQSLLNYAQTYGSTSFPDVGGFSIRRSGQKLRVTDEVALGDWLQAQGYEDAYARVERVEYEVNLDAAKIIADGMLGETGEVPPGMAVVPESESLTVRGIK